MACISLPTAALIGGGLSAAGGVASAVLGASAAKQAAKTQAQAAQEAIDTTKDLFGQTKGELQPFITAGAGAIPTVENLLGLPGAGGGAPDMTAALAALKATPGYQFTLQQGLQAAQSGFASQGLAESGAAIKGATSYAEGLAGNTYEQQLNNYLNLFGQGAGSAQALGGITTNTAQALSGLITGKGAATASGTIGATNALTGGLTNAFSGLSNSALILGLNNAGLFRRPTESAYSDIQPVASTPTAPSVYNALYGGVR